MKNPSTDLSKLHYGLAITKKNYGNLRLDQFFIWPRSSKSDRAPNQS